ncbi:MAG: DNA polymerase, partial [Geminicoccaceae bacterium]
GYVKTALGRRRRYTNPRAQNYQAINSICQGNNADIIKMKMIEVDDYLRSSGRGQLAFSIHDALVNYLDPANDHETAAEIIRICETFNKEEQGIEFRVNMKLDSGHGPNWSIASYGEAA